MRKDPHIWFVLIALCFLVFVATGCKKARLRAQLKDLMASTIVLPEKISCVYNGEVFPMPDSLRNKPKLVIYIDSTECTTCRISHLWEYQTLFDLSSQTGSFYVMILMWNTEFKSIPLVRYLLDQNVTYPVFVDLNRSFLKDNSTIPDDIRMHSLLLDSLNKVKFVGDPSATTNMLEVFKQALEGNDME